MAQRRDLLEGFREEVEVVGSDERLVGEHQRLLDTVLELADVARPLVFAHRLERARREALHVGGILLGVLLQEVFADDDHVLAALTKRREVEVHDVEPVEEILAEGALLDLLFEVAVRRRDDADVDLLGAVVADLHDHPLLEGAEQLHLQRERHLADLVQEERAGVGLLELAGAGGDRAGERAAHVPEELGLHEVLGDGSAVDHHERPLRAR